MQGYGTDTATPVDTRFSKRFQPVVAVEDIMLTGQQKRAQRGLEQR
jgi:hypothetical protein